MSKRYGSIEERFWRDVNPEPNSGCWLWSGAVDELGYGRFRVGDKKVRVHRLSYEMHCEAIPAGMVVRHKCDVAACVNPAHLCLGTDAENVRDKVARNRQARGERLPSAKLTEDDVRAIRRMDGTHREIARQFGVAHNIIGNIKRGIDWRHVF